MALVYKAFRDESNNVVFVCFTSNASTTDKINMLKGNKVPKSSQVCLVRSDRSDIEIPKEYKISSISGNIKEIHSPCDIDVLIKDLDPNISISPKPVLDNTLTRDSGDWLMYEGKPLCTFPKDISKGVWSKDGEVIRYREESNVRIMRDTFLRHKSDKEFMDLTMNLDTGLCLYSFKKFDDTYSLEKHSRFNIQYRYWEAT